jgi:hypothetical protein
MEMNWSQVSMKVLYKIDKPTLTPHHRHINLDSWLCHRADSVKPFVNPSLSTLGHTISGSRLGYCYHMHVSSRIL